VLGIVYRMISAYIFKEVRLTRASGATGAVTLIQRFGSALNLNVHFHALVLDGAYLVGTEPPVFRRIEPPRQEELQALVERLAERIGRALERRGVLARDADNSYLELDLAAGRRHSRTADALHCPLAARGGLYRRPSSAPWPNGGSYALGGSVVVVRCALPEDAFTRQPAHIVRCAALMSSA